MAGKKQANKQEIENRIRIVADELLNGLSRGKIIEKYAELWDLSASSFDAVYLKRAYQYIKDNVKEDINLIREININRLTDIYNNAYNHGDTNSMFRAIDMINKMAGTYIERKDISVAISEFNFKFTE